MTLQTDVSVELFKKITQSLGAGRKHAVLKEVDSLSCVATGRWWSGEAFTPAETRGQEGTIKMKQKWKTLVAA